MLSGVRFVPRDQLEERRHGSKEEKRRTRKGKGRKEEYSDDSHTSDDEEDDDHEEEESNSRRRKKKKNKKLYDSELASCRRDDKKQRDEGRRHGEKNKEIKGDGDNKDDDVRSHLEHGRREAGLTWMLESTTHGQEVKAHEAPEGPKHLEEVERANPKELNPYLKDNGGGYPDEASLGRHQLLPSSVVGDGGASWRLKALKRAKEQAAREGKKLDEVVEERWGSLGQLAVSVASHRAAPARAHLHAIKDRKKGIKDSSDPVLPDRKGEGGEETKSGRKSYLEGVSSHHSDMRKPTSYSWRKGKDHHSHENKSLISAAISGLNKFTNNGSFMDMFNRNKDVAASDSSSMHARESDNADLSPSKNSASERESFVDKGDLNPNQLAAKAFQLRLKGKHEEADTLLKEVGSMKHKQTSNIKTVNPENKGRYIERKFSNKKREEDADLYLAQKIVRNKQFSISKQADDEYDFDDDAPKRKGHKKQENVPGEKKRISNRLLTQEQRCQFCFENSTRPKHLAVAIAQFTYMALPAWQPVVQGHCCILPMQHESSTRSVDDNVWEELRNFKKCLIMMFDKQDKDVVFLETVMGLAKQQRHCLVECVPLPRDVAKEAPLYFKKAIDEAEDEWSQHNSKKLIRTTREKGLRRCIPKDFPYFHVEFGLDEGFVHVIDDEGKFNGGLGLNVIRGMLRLSEEDMYRRRRHEPPEKQRLAAAAFAQDWEPFDWTKQLN